MKIYQQLLEKIIQEGVKKKSRTGVETLSLFGERMKFELDKGFPILTAKSVYFKGVVAELLWFLRGDTNIGYLHEHNCKIWDEWADETGDLGPVYGKQWRSWKTDRGEIDQIKEVIEKIKTVPDSRRLVISAWNPADLPDESLSPQENVKRGKMALAACHTLFQFYVADGKLSCQLYARSQDFFLGTPFNIASYSLLTILMAKETGLEPGDFIWVGGDTHLYLNHMEQAHTLLQREPFPLPTLKIKDRGSIFDYEPSDFELIDYRHHPPIKAPIAV